MLGERYEHHCFYTCETEEARLRREHLRNLQTLSSLAYLRREVLYLGTRLLDFSTQPASIMSSVPHPNVEESGYDPTVHQVCCPNCDRRQGPLTEYYARLATFLPQTQVLKRSTLPRDESWMISLGTPHPQASSLQYLSFPCSMDWKVLHA